MPLGYTTVSGTALKDASGNPISNASITFQPVTDKGVPISFLAAGDVPTTLTAVTAQVTGGVFSLLLADTTLTSPANVGYAVTVINNLTGASLLGPGYGCIQPSGATWNFDTNPPAIPPQAIVYVGPPGPTGPTGATGPTGPTGPQGAASTVPGPQGTPGNPRMLLDPTAVVLNHYIDAHTGVVTSGSSSACVSGMISVIPGQKYVLNVKFDDFSSGGVVGGAYYLNGTFVSGFSSASPGVAAGTIFTVPASVNQINITLHADVSGIPVAKLMIYSDVIVPAIPVPFGSGVDQAAATAVAAANVTLAALQQWSGKSCAVFGDSIEDIYGYEWLPQLMTALGMTIAAQDTRAGRVFRAIFENFTDGQTLTGATAASTRVMPLPNGGTCTATVGETITTFMAGIPVAFIMLGTNDSLTGSVRTPGTPGDAFSAATLCGDVGYAISVLLAANPTMRIILVAPYQTGISFAVLADQINAVNAIKGTAARWGEPVIDQFSRIGFNQSNIATYLQGDKVHPTTAGGVRMTALLTKEILAIG